MKNLYLLLFCIILSSKGFAQDRNVMIGTEHKVTRAISLDPDKVYNKQTGEKLRPEEVLKLMQEMPNIRLEPEFGEDGKVARFIYYPETSPGIPVSRPAAGEPGSPFPSFDMKTTEGENVRLEDLKGKVVVMHFALDAMRFRYDELEKLDAQINALEHPEKVVGLVVLGSREQTLAAEFDAEASNFSLVNQGTGHIQRYGLDWLPVTLVIDREGRLLGQFKRVDDLDLKSYF